MVNLYINPAILQNLEQYTNILTNFFDIKTWNFKGENNEGIENITLEENENRYTTYNLNYDKADNYFTKGVYILDLSSIIDSIIPFYIDEADLGESILYIILPNTTESKKIKWSVAFLKELLILKGRSLKAVSIVFPDKFYISKKYIISTILSLGQLYNVLIDNNSFLVKSFRRIYDPQRIEDWLSKVKDLINRIEGGEEKYKYLYKLEELKQYINDAEKFIEEGTQYTLLHPLNEIVEKIKETILSNNLSSIVDADSKSTTNSYVILIYDDIPTDKIELIKELFEQYKLKYSFLKTTNIELSGVYIYRYDTIPLKHIYIDDERSTLSKLQSLVKGILLSKKEDFINRRIAEYLIYAPIAFVDDPAILIQHINSDIDDLIEKINIMNDIIEKLAEPIGISATPLEESISIINKIEKETKEIERMWKSILKRLSLVKILSPQVYKANEDKYIRLAEKAKKLILSLSKYKPAIRMNIYLIGNIDTVMVENNIKTLTGVLKEINNYFR